MGRWNLVYVGALLAALAAGAGAAQTISKPGDPVRVPVGDAVKIHVHGICRVVANVGTTPAAAPNRAPSEWAVGTNSFLALRRGDLVAVPCDDPDPDPCPSRALSTPFGHAPAMVTMVLDESGSMSSYRGSIVRSVNTMIDKLKTCGEDVYVSLYKFNTAGAMVDTVWEMKPISEVTTFADAQYAPSGGTPLFSAMNSVIAKMDGFASTRPGWRKVLVVQTDGLNTESGTASSVATRVNPREASGWQFMYLGTYSLTGTIIGTISGDSGPRAGPANHFSQAGSMGFDNDKMVAYDTFDGDVTFKTAAKNASDFVAGFANTVGWNIYQRKAFAGRIP